MTDLIDRACEIEQMQRDLALKTRKKSTALSAEFCMRCDEPIPKKRRQAIQGVRLCVDCQQQQERRQREYRK